jgi:hypothetical protein
MTIEPMTAAPSIIDTDELGKYFHLLTSQIGTIPSHFESGLSISVRCSRYQKDLEFRRLPSKLSGDIVCVRDTSPR